MAQELVSGNTNSLLTDQKTGLSVRLAARNGTCDSFTSGLAPTYLQTNLIVLPSEYAADFRLLCRRNPAPCPLLAESKAVGVWDALRSYIDGVEDEQLAETVDLRRDFPRYMVYRDGVVVKSHCRDIVEDWTSDHVAFLIGCSYSFESALAAAGLTPLHVTLRRNVAMYRTCLPLCPAGVFHQATFVVSMRPYRKRDVENVRRITRPFVAVHGEPIGWGWEAVARLGIQDVSQPEWGDPPLSVDGQVLVEAQHESNDMVVPVFWACGVTPQEAIVQANLPGTVMGHAPGHMLVLDVRDWDVVH